MLVVGASKNLTLLIIFWGTTNQAIEQKISQHGKRNKNEINKYELKNNLFVFTDHKVGHFEVNYIITNNIITTSYYL